MTDEEFFPVPERELREAGVDAALEPIRETLAGLLAEVRADSAADMATERRCTTCGSHLRLALDLGPWSDPFASTVSGRFYCPADQGHQVDAP